MASKALTSPPPSVKESTFMWEGRDRGGKTVRGEMRAGGEAVVSTTLRRQGITVVKIRKQRYKTGKKIQEKDITLFTRQLSTMMKAGVPLLQAFDIVAKGTDNQSVAKLFTDIRGDVETGTALSQAFRKYPLYFDSLFCNLVGAGEQAGILDDLLDRLAMYKEKMLAIKGKIKSALFYPVAVMGVAAIVVVVIMLFVIPAFKSVFASFGADLPAPTLIVMAMSDFFVSYWYILFGAIFGFFYFLMQAWKRSTKVQIAVDRLMLKLPIFGNVLRKATIARWLRTGRGPRLGGRRGGQLRLPARHEEDPVRGRHRYQPHGVDAEREGLPEHGAADGGDRRGVRFARRDARQVGGHLRARGRRGGREPVLADGAADHGGARDDHRRPGGRDVPADLQARSGGLSGTGAGAPEPGHGPATSRSSAPMSVA